MPKFKFIYFLWSFIYQLVYILLKSYFIEAILLLYTYKNANIKCFLILSGLNFFIEHRNIHITTRSF